jgi:hypothetical protein
MFNDISSTQEVIEGHKVVCVWGYDEGWLDGDSETDRGVGGSWRLLKYGLGILRKTTRAKNHYMKDKM